MEEHYSGIKSEKDTAHSWGKTDPEQENCWWMKIGILVFGKETSRKAEAKSTNRFEFGDELSKNLEIEV